MANNGQNALFQLFCAKTWRNTHVKLEWLRRGKMGRKWHGVIQRRIMPERKSMYTIKDFLNGKIAVVVHAQWQWNDFIDICKKYGATFANDATAKEWPHDFEHRPEIIYCVDGQLLMWDFANTEFKQIGRYKVHVNELLCPAVQESGRILAEVLPKGFPKPEPKPAPKWIDCFCSLYAEKPKKQYKIIIDCCGDTTTARLLVDGRTVKKTTAKRNPADKFNLRIGAQMAFNRLWKKKKKPE